CPRSRTSRTPRARRPPRATPPRPPSPRPPDPERREDREARDRRRLAIAIVVLVRLDVLEVRDVDDVEVQPEAPPLVEPLLLDPEVDLAERRHAHRAEPAAHRLVLAGVGVVRRADHGRVGAAARQ